MVANNKDTFSIKMKVPSQGNQASIKKVIPYYRYMRTFKMLEPERRKGIENGLDRV
jgi:hypothetical protein